MKEPKSLSEFKEFTRRVHSSYSLVNSSLDLLGQNIKSSAAYDKNSNYEIVDEDSNQVISSFPNFHIIKGVKKDGPISQLVAHGLLSWIYYAWEDRARKMIANELGVDKNNVMCDLMGDIRTLRHKIAHNLGTLDKDAKTMKVITWLKEGHIILKTDDMNKIQIELNKMKIYVR